MKKRIMTLLLAAVLITAIAVPAYAMTPAPAELDPPMPPKSVQVHVRGDGAVIEVEDGGEARVTGYRYDGKEYTVQEMQEMKDVPYLSWTYSFEYSDYLYIAAIGSAEHYCIGRIDRDEWEYSNVLYAKGYTGTRFDYDLKTGELRQSYPDGTYGAIMYIIDGVEYSMEQMRAARSLGMPIAKTVDKKNGVTTELGGYKFVEKDGTSLSNAMYWLEDMHLRPGLGRYYSTEWTYVSKHGNLGFDVDVESKTVTFTVDKDVSEIPTSLMLSILHTAIELGNK